MSNKTICRWKMYVDMILKQTVEARWHLTNGVSLVPLRAEPSERRAYMNRRFIFWDTLDDLPPSVCEGVLPARVCVESYLHTSLE